GFPDGTDDAAGQRADVGAPVTADLRLVPHAAERDPDELAPHRARHRLVKRPLADARRADERNHRAGTPSADDTETTVGTPLAHRQVLDDPVLHVVEPGVVLVEDLARARDVVGVLGPLVPRDVQDGVKPGPDPARLR